MRSTDTEFDALAAAVARRGLRALHTEGVAYVYTPEEAARIEELADARRGPSRTTPVPAPRRKIA